LKNDISKIVIMEKVIDRNTMVGNSKLALDSSRFDPLSIKRLFNKVFVPKMRKTPIFYSIL